MIFSRSHAHFLAQALTKAAVLGTLIFLSPAQALQWNIDNGTQTDVGLVIAGDFSIDDELQANPVMLASNVTLDGLVFGANGSIISSTPNVGITAIDWVDINNNLLSLAFTTPLTPQGGTIVLDDVVSSFTPFNATTPSFISGSVTGSTSAVPGAVPALGAGAALAWSRRIRRRINTAGNSRQQ